MVGRGQGATVGTRIASYTSVLPYREFSWDEHSIFG